MFTLIKDNKYKIATFVACTSVVLVSVVAYRKFKSYKRNEINMKPFELGIEAVSSIKLNRGYKNGYVEVVIEYKSDDFKFNSNDAMQLAEKVLRRKVKMKYKDVDASQIEEALYRKISRSVIRVNKFPTFKPSELTSIVE